MNAGLCNLFRGPEYPFIIFQGDHAYEHIDPVNVEWFKTQYPEKEQIVQDDRSYIEVVNKWKK